MEFIKYGSVHIFNSEQRTEDWEDQRKGRVTASRLYDVINSYPESRRQILEEIICIRNRVFDEKSIILMNQGTEHEPIARKKFIELTGINVVELGLAVPEWNNYIGVSVDGLCSDGCLLEIKSPDKLYNNLKIYRATYGSVFPQTICLYNGMIKERHYCQMQMQMAVMGKDYCYYMVDPVHSDETIIMKIKFNIDYWRDAYFRLSRIINNELKPMLEEFHLTVKSPWNL